jgi:lipid-binding SYLF domain-containing protein
MGKMGFLTGCLIVGLTIMAGGCQVSPKSSEASDVLEAQVAEAIAVMRAEDPDIERFFQRSYGYAVLPKVFKGAFVLGGAYGKGIVYQQGQKIGYCNMKQGTLGFSFGGEFFREIIFFRDQEDLAKFRNEEFTFSAQVTGVALTKGAAAKADYKSGMAVFVVAESGLMVDASLGGQKFSFVPLISSR